MNKTFQTLLIYASEFEYIENSVVARPVEAVELKILDHPDTSLKQEQHLTFTEHTAKSSLILTSKKQVQLNISSKNQFTKNQRDLIHIPAESITHQLCNYKKNSVMLVEIKPGVPDSVLIPKNIRVLLRELFKMYCDIMTE